MFVFYDSHIETDSSTKKFNKDLTNVTLKRSIYTPHLLEVL